MIVDARVLIQQHVKETGSYEELLVVIQSVNIISYSPFRR